jgi:hypothetical protein
MVLNGFVALCNACVWVSSAAMVDEKFGNKHYCDDDKVRNSSGVLGAIAPHNLFDAISLFRRQSGNTPEWLPMVGRAFCGGCFCVRDARQRVDASYFSGILGLAIRPFVFPSTPRPIRS